ncbi:MAG: indole-3-glycerol phosphate synthase [Chlamydiales bacterium]|jgi:indole-3-glycerol phosphate synthase
MTTGTRLDPILESVREQAALRRRQQSVADLRAELEPDPARRERFVAGLRADGLSIIAECKRRSPSVGELSGEVDLLERAQSYARGGADALSVLTESNHFGGAPADLAQVAQAGLPRLRKDFLLDEGMLLESVAMGADAVLLLVVCLPGGQLEEMRALARECGLAVLVEIHHPRELERAVAVEPDCLGVNARDLTTFEVDLQTVVERLPEVPDSCVRIAESGLRTIDDLQRVRAAGADAVLVGETLMRAASPEETLRSWKAACK